MSARTQPDRRSMTKQGTPRPQNDVRIGTKLTRDWSNCRRDCAAMPSLPPAGLPIQTRSRGNAALRRVNLSSARPK